MNLTLPFDEVELDEYLARIDQELDALFLDDVAEAMAHRAAEPEPAPPAVAAA